MYIHNKNHKTSHYTTASSVGLEQAEDSIASSKLPFKGIFYSIFTDRYRADNISSNSYDWWSVYSTIRNLSANWAPNFNLYNFVRSLSNNWNTGYTGYTYFSPISSNYDYLKTIIFNNSASWTNSNILRSNVAREYTASKTFSGYSLVYTNSGDISWNLDDAQAAFISLTADSLLKNPTNRKNGGLYTLTIKQDLIPRTLTFDSAYRLYKLETGPVMPNGTVTENVINILPDTITYITFVCDGLLMFGDVSYSGVL